MEGYTYCRHRRACKTMTIPQGIQFTGSGLHNKTGEGVHTFDSTNTIVFNPHDGLMYFDFVCAVSQKMYLEIRNTRKTS
jgi:hypothetical protein